jgi:PHD/YefM family antitoxin component YafN of YafNO toxin-antitoxin module
MNRFKEQYVIDKKGQRTAAILPIKKYEKLMEDLHDLAIVAERKGEPTISLNKLKQDLKKNGLL